jgi:hypothetical protein
MLITLVMVCLLLPSGGAVMSFGAGVHCSVDVLKTQRSPKTSPVFFSPPYIHTNELIPTILHMYVFIHIHNVYVTSHTLMKKIRPCSQHARHATEQSTCMHVAKTTSIHSSKDAIPKCSTHEWSTLASGPPE